jgi:predicted O-linked N-acetylglucosamine transferase (SPINDLY family)
MLSWLFGKRRASAAGSDGARTLFQEGTALAQGGRLEEAIGALRRAVELAPALAEAHFNLGSACRDLGRPQEALIAYRRAVALVPRSADAHLALGALLREQGSLDEAAACLRRAIELAPANADAHLELGHLLTAIGEWREARAAFRRASELRPELAAARWAAAMAEIPALDEGQPAERRAAFAAALEALERWFREARPPEAFRAVAVHQPFFLAYQEAQNRDLLARYGALCAQLMAPWQRSAGLAAPAARARGGRIRVGIVSAHVANHSVWNALGRAWVERLERGRFEVAVFHLGAAEDGETRFARERADAYHAGRRSFESWARAIHASRPDVLLYPEVGMDATTAKLAALRLAPVQAASWGHPETTGLPTIDHYLSAAALEPPGAQANYTERLEVLPGLGCWLEPSRARTDREALPLAGEARVRLVCPGMPFKYAASYDGLLVEIARRVPAAQLVFFRNRPENLSRKLEARLRRRFAEAGLELESHVTFVPWQSLEKFRGVLASADIYLDTVGFSGFNTAVHALECELPVLTREGRFLRGRLASGLLRHAGLDDLVAPSDERYVELAVELASDARRREALRRQVRERCRRLYADPAPLDALQEFLARAAGR